MAPASTVLAQSVIVEGDELFPAILQHLQILYPEVYVPVVSLGWEPACRDFCLVEDGEGLSGGSLSGNSFSKLGAYTGKFNHLSPSIARMNNPRPNLTHFYLDNSPVVPTMDPLEYAPHKAALSSLTSIPRLGY